MRAEGDEIHITGKVIAGMIERFRYIQDDRRLQTYPEVSTLGLKWDVGDTVQITIRRIPKSQST